MKSPQTNRNRVYNLVYHQERISKPEIAVQLGISVPTAAQCVKDLADNGLLLEGETLESTGGRKAAGVTVAKNAKVAIGTDITRNNVSIVLVNLAAQIIESIRIHKEFVPTPTYFQEVVALIRQMVEVSGVAAEDILGAGFSLPGITSADGGTLTHSHVLSMFAIPAGAIGRSIPYQILLCNDANAAGIAEMWNKPAQSNAVYFSLSSTVGGAVIMGNELYAGDNQRGGEFGHMTLVPDGLPCYCGRKGCVDAYCSTLLLSKHTRGNLALFFDRLAAGDKRLRPVWERYESHLAVAVNNLISTFDCPVILGGYLGEYMEARIDHLRERVAELVTFPGTEAYITPCSYKREAAAVGAALLFIRQFIDEI